MLKDSKVFSSFSVKDIDAAEKFYGETLQLDVKKTPEGLALKLKGGYDVFIYPKEDHQPATFTVLNFIVEELEKTVDQLSAKGISFEQYNYEEFKTNEKGIFRSDSGPRMIAWFKYNTSQIKIGYCYFGKSLELLAIRPNAPRFCQMNQIEKCRFQHSLYPPANAENNVAQRIHLRQ